MCTCVYKYKYKYCTYITCPRNYGDASGTNVGQEYRDKLQTILKKETVKRDTSDLEVRKGGPTYDIILP